MAKVTQCDVCASIAPTPYTISLYDNEKPLDICIGKEFCQKCYDRISRMFLPKEQPEQQNLDNNKIESDLDESQGLEIFTKDQIKKRKIKNKPKDRLCNVCQSPSVYNTGVGMLQCSNKVCGKFLSEIEFKEGE